MNDKSQPVVMFALEWCEFCWSVRRLMKEFAIPYRSIDLDSVEYQGDNRGGDIRVALRQKIGSPTIPQIFIGGEYIGGCTETFDAFNQGRLQKLLEANGVAFDRAKEGRRLHLSSRSGCTRDEGEGPGRAFQPRARPGGDVRRQRRSGGDGRRHQPLLAPSERPDSAPSRGRRVSEASMILSALSA